MSSVAVAGLGVFIPGSSGGPDDPQPSTAILDKSSRRRGSLLTRALGDAYKQALDQSGLDPTAVGSVFGLALGEASTMIGLLDQLWRKDGVLSPMRFAGSVHNTAAGAISIGTRNTGLTTSIAADFDTPAMALIEAIGIVLTHGTPVIVACGDEAAPNDLVMGDQGWCGLACALALAPLEAAGARQPRISLPRRGVTPTLSAADLPRDLAQNPQAGMLDLIERLRGDASGSVRLDRGSGHGYCVDIVRAS